MTAQPEAYNQLVNVLTGFSPTITEVTNGEPAFVYFLYQTARVGQLSQEIWQAKIISPQAKKRVFVVPKKEDTIEMNQAVRDEMVGDDLIVEQPIEAVRTMGRISAGTIETGGHKYLMFSPQDLYNTVGRHYIRGDQVDCLPVSKDMMKRANQLKKALGISKGKKLVSLHMREPGYLPEMSYHSYRDADPVTYIPTIQWLLEEGYVVIRFGDKSMQPMPFDNPNFIDAPFDERYTPEFESLLIPASDFFLGTHSGPYSIARAYDVPILVVNGAASFAIAGGEKDMVVYKRFYDRQRKKFLNYREFISDLNVRKGRSDELLNSGLNWLNNSPQEILSATQEMVQRLNGQYPINPKIDQYCKTLEQQATAIDPNTFFAPFFGKASLSQEYLKSVPDYLPMD